MPNNTWTCHNCQKEFLAKNLFPCNNPLNDHNILLCRECLELQEEENQPIEYVDQFEDLTYREIERLR